MTFSAGGVLRRAFGVLGANVPTAIVSTLLVFVPVLGVALIAGSGAPGHWYQIPTEEIAVTRQPPLAGQFVIGILAFLAQYLLAGLMTYTTLEHLQGRRVGVAEGVVKGIQYALPGLDVVFMTGIVVGVGFLLAVVPGAILACMWFVAVPVAAVEKPGFLKVFPRSRALTDGHRLSLLGVLLATLGLMFASGLLLPGLLEDLGRTTVLLASLAAQAFFGLLAGLTQVVAYHDLRVIEEGVPPTELVREFDTPDDAL